MARTCAALAAAGAGACLLTAATAAWMPGVAQARASALSFTVNTTADAHDAHPGDGQCADSAGQCSLRAALEEADASPSGSAVTIAVPAGTYALTLGSLTAGSASVPLTITVDGAGAASTVVKATGKFRVMTVTAHATASLGNLQVTGGKAGPNSYGGGIFSQGKLTLSGDTLTGNTAGAGGGVANAGGSLTVTSSPIESNNGGGFGGGGIQNGGPKNVPGTVLVGGSTISGNVTTNEGGGIFSGQNGSPACPRPGRGRAPPALPAAAVRPGTSARRRRAGPHRHPQLGDRQPGQQRRRRHRRRGHRDPDRQPGERTTPPVPRSVAGCSTSARSPTARSRATPPTPAAGSRTTRAWS